VSVATFDDERTNHFGLLDLSVGSALLLIALSLLGISEPHVVSNLVITDLFVFALIVTWTMHVARGDSRSHHEASQLVAPVSLILGGSLIAAIHVGVRGFVLDDLVRDLGAFCSFLAALDIFRRSRDAVLRWAVDAVMVAATMLTVTLLLDPTLRAHATFPNPNVPGHLLACALLLFAFAPMSRRLRVLIIAVSLVGLYRTGSFGASLQIGVSFGYLLITRVLARTRTRERARVTFFALLGLVALAATFGIASYLNSPRAKQESGLSSARLDRSSSTRFDVWHDAFNNFRHHPFGSGPGSSRALHLLTKATETHNEPLSYLSERGIIAFAGLLLLWITVWRITRRGGIARAMLCGYLVASIFRETLHYRHWWLFLALAMVLDERGVAATPGRRSADSDGVTLGASP
jgi:O-Antigen ligase